MICGGELVTGIMAAIGIASAMASTMASGNPLGLLGLLGPLTMGIGSFAGPMAGAAGSMIPSATAVPGNIAGAASGAGINAATAGLGAGSNIPSLISGGTGFALDPALAAASASLPSLTSSSLSPAVQAGTAALSQAGGAPTLDSGGIGLGGGRMQPPTTPNLPPPTSISLPKTPRLDRFNHPQTSTLQTTPTNTPTPATPKVSFAEKAGNFLWGKPPDPSMFGDDPQGKMLGAIMQMQYENQKGAMQRGLLGGGLQGLASMTSGLLEDDEYKPDYTVKKGGKRFKTPREMRTYNSSAPSHTDLLKRIGFKTNA